MATKVQERQSKSVSAVAARRGPQSIVFSDADLWISVRPSPEPSSRRVAFVSFAGVGLDEAGGEPSVQREEFGASLPAGADVFIVRDRKRRWFNGIDRRVVDTLTHEIREGGYDRVVLIGNAMGGSGAMLFAAALPKVSDAIAFMPQVSIHPDVAPFDPRFAEFASRVTDWTVRDVRERLAAGPRYHVVVGDQMQEDLRQADLLQAVPGIALHRYVIEGSLRDLGKDLKTRGYTLGALIRAMIDAPDRAADMVSQKEPARGRAKKEEPRMAVNENAVNKVELRVFAPSRRAAGTLCSWLVRQFEEPVGVVLDLEPGKNPFAIGKVHEMPGAAPLDLRTEAGVAAAVSSRREALVLSYPGAKLNRLSQAEVVPQHDSAVGVSGVAQTVLVLPGFVDYIMRIVLQRHIRGESAEAIAEKLKPAIALWRIHAREFMGQTRFLGASVIRVAEPAFTKRASKRREVRTELARAMGSDLPVAARRVAASPAKQEVDQRLTKPAAADISGEEFAPIRKALGSFRAKVEPLDKAACGGTWPEDWRA